jgi:hypothetical protein
MGRSSIWRALAAALALGALTTPAQSAPALSAPDQSAPAGACGRACLGALLDRYLAAVTAHDPSRVPLAFGFRQTQNAVVIAPGEGLWRDAAGLGPVRRTYLDPANGAAAYFGTLVLGGGETAVAALRLHVTAGKVDEAEWNIARAGDPGIAPGEKAMFDAPNLIAHPPPPRAVPASGRLSRAELVAVANSYFDGITSANPRIIMAHPGCSRMENGLQTTGRRLPAGREGEGPGGVSDCTSGQGRFGVALVAGRRYPVVDEQAQVVLAIGTFLRTPDEPKRRNQFMEFFYVDQGRIGSIYAAFFYPPPAQPVPNWPPYEGHFPLPADFGAAK